MTTITIDRSLLQQALDALTYQGTMGPTRRQRRAAAVAALRAALSAPATAPAQPSWHDAPTEPGLWVRNSHEGIGVYSVYSISEAATKILKGGYARWYGPIPEDKP